MKVMSFDRFDMRNNPGSKGIAFTIWFSGCSEHCVGCHNKKLWDSSNGIDVDIEDIEETIKNARVNYTDIVLLGGEPLEQPIPELENLVHRLSEKYKVWLYTSWELHRVPGSILRKLHFIKTGRYIQVLRQKGFPASSNQRVYMRDDNKKLIQIGGNNNEN